MYCVTDQHISQRVRQAIVCHYHVLFLSRCGFKGHEQQICLLSSPKRRRISQLVPAGNEPIVHEACHSNVTGFMHDRGKCVVSVCIFGSTEGPSFVLHRCMCTDIRACLLLVIQETGFSIKFAFPWRPDQAGMEFPRSTDGKVDEQFHRPMHKDTCTHASAHNRTSCECRCIRTYKGYSVVPSMWPPGTIGLPTFSNVYFGSTGIPMAFGSQDQEHS